MPKKGLGDSRQRRSMRRYLKEKKLKSQRGKEREKYWDGPRFKKVENGRDTWETELAYENWGV